MTTADLPSWCPPPLRSACAAASKSSLPGMPSVHAQVSASAERLKAEHADVGDACYMFVHLGGREQSVGICVSTAEGGEVLEVLSLADTELSDKKTIAALAANGKPRLAGFVTLEVDGAPHLFARASNLLETLDDDELDRMIVTAARLADDWEARQSQGGDQW